MDFNAPGSDAIRSSESSRTASVQFCIGRPREISGCFRNVRVPSQAGRLSSGRTRFRHFGYWATELVSRRRKGYGPFFRRGIGPGSRAIRKRSSWLSNGLTEIWPPNNCPLGVAQISRSAWHGLVDATGRLLRPRFRDADHTTRWERTIVAGSATILAKRAGRSDRQLRQL